MIGLGAKWHTEETRKEGFTGWGTGSCDWSPRTEASFDGFGSVQRPAVVDQVRGAEDPYRFSSMEEDRAEAINGNLGPDSYEFLTQ
jgi:hypothetical protein